MYSITINGSTPEELFANIARMAAANTSAAPAAVPQMPTAAPALPASAVAQNPQATQPSPVAAPVAPAPAPAPAPMPAPAPAPMPTPALAPAPAPAPTPAPAVPSAAPTYTLDALARAGATLAQSGKMQEALALLAKYGVQTVNQLRPEQYGAFATELRALGAQV